MRTAPGSETGSVQIVYRFAGFSAGSDGKRRTAPGEQESRCRERGDGQQSDSKATNRRLQVVGSVADGTNIHVSARVAPGVPRGSRPTYFSLVLLSVTRILTRS